MTTSTAERVDALFVEKGVEVSSGSNAPFLLEDPSSAWLVAEGKLDVFAVRVVGERPEGARNYLFSIRAGDLALGVEPAWADEVGLLAVGTPGTRAFRLPLAELRTLGRDPDLRRALERYVLVVSSAVSRRNSPRVDLTISAGDAATAPDGITVASHRGVAWVRLDSGSLLFDGRADVAVHAGEGLFPLAAGAWMKSVGTTELRALVDDEIETDALWLGLRTFQRTALEWADLVLRGDRAFERDRLGRRITSDRQARSEALESLAGVIAEERHSILDTSGGPLLTACQMVGERLRLRFVATPSWERTRGNLTDALRAICRASAVGSRRVVLSPGWWSRDNGPLLGFMSAEGATEEAASTPVALLSSGTGRYTLVNPLTAERTPVDEDVAARLEPFGYQFYRSLPARRLTVRDLWRFVTFRSWGDLRILVLMGALGAALGILLPILTGVVFDQVIPSADRSQLLSVFVALAVSALAAASFEVTRSLAVIRLHTRVSADLQMAVLDRMVRLPLPFFRRFTAGDLALRAAGIGSIGNALSGATISSLLSAVVSAGSYVLLFVYSPALALLATLLLAVNAAFTVGVASVSLRFARKQQEANGKLAGLVLQLLTGVAKLRVSGSEARAFARWAAEFRRQREMAFQVGRFDNVVQVFNSVLAIASTLAVYWAYTALSDSAGGLTTGRFLAFNAAFGIFMGAGLSVTSTAIGLLALVPTWERARPILEEEPEADPARPDPGEITGRIEVSHLTFRYAKDGPVILHDVSLQADPGEFVALVGPSGAGKSTLLRVLLAFDLPETSSVYYDGHDLATVDVTALRRQIGVVLQSSKLTAGDIYTNIVGAAALPMEEAWEAARMAGLEDDLREMPMGLHTVVSEGGGTLSGGQRQRLLIARALVHRPRVLFFDEATSALDNRTQKIVSESIAQLHATRVVIAHRLSTIRHADRIYVMDQGRVVQVGTFDHLISRPGLFAELAARQEA
jgi:NHLM bacteriocin system ABC transporter ATP-binding protein